MVHRMLQLTPATPIVVSILAWPRGWVQPLTQMPKPLAHDSYGAWRSPWKVRWGKPCSLVNHVNALVTSWGIKGKRLVW